MASQRQLKIGKLLQKEIAAIFQESSIIQDKTALTTVKEVNISPDLSSAKIYLSVFPETKEDKILEQIEDQKNSLRKELGNRLRNNLRIIPELFLYIDKSASEAARMERLINKLDIPPDEK